MLAFLASGAAHGVGTPVVPLALHVPRSGVTLDAPHLRAAVAGQGGPPAGSGVGAAALAQQAVIVAVACGVLAAARRRRGTPRSRVALGPTYGTYHEYKFRAKPGDKYKYRYSTDRTPEWGVIPEAKGRYVKYGELLCKGTPTGPERYKKMQEIEQSKAPGMDGETAGALLCDCDGTLVETERDGHRVAFNKAFKEKGLDCEWDVELYGELLTTGGGKERMARYFKDYKPEAWPHEEAPAKDHPAIVELHALKTKLFMEIVRSGELPLREGIKELLTAAEAAGWTLAVCSTSNQESVTAVVETMLPEFAASMRVFAGDCVSAKKPDPEIYQLAAKELGLAPMKCVVLEDTNIGMQAGKAAGMKVIVTKSIYSEGEDFDAADIVVASAEELDFESEVATMLPTLTLA